MREISPVADPATRTYAVKVTLNNPPPQVRFGMSVGGRLKGKTALAVALPLSVLFEKMARRRSGSSTSNQASPPEVRHGRAL